MNYRWFSLFLLLTAPVLGQTIQPEQLRADLTYFRNALAEAHPAMYRYTPKPTFDSLFSATAAQLDHPMTQQEFYVTMAPLLVALHDGHVKWIPAGQDEHYPFATAKLFPLRLYIVGARAWVIGNYGREYIPAGAELLTVNNQSIAAIIQKLLPNMTFGDGYSQTAKYGDLNHFFSGYYATFIAAPDNFTVTYRTGNNDTTVSLPAVTKQAITAYTDAHKPKSQPGHRLTFIEDGATSRTAVLTVERFWTEKGEKSFKTSLKDAFRQIREKQITNLVLDLRSNEGGEESFGVALYSYLIGKPSPYYDRIAIRKKQKPSFPAWTPKIYRLAKGLAVKKRHGEYVWTVQRGLKTIKPQADAYHGPLYVLLNGYSFSVTTELASRLQSDKRGVFIGEETGGGYTGDNSGFFAVTNLPNSKIDLGIPMLGFYMAGVDASLPTNRGILPDLTIVPTVDDVLTGADPVMKQALQRIQQAGNGVKSSLEFGVKMN